MSKLLTAAALAMFAALEPASAAFAPNRIVTAVDYAAKTLSCQADAGEPSYAYKTTSKTIIRISRKGLRPHLLDRRDFSEIKVGEIITVQYHLDGDDRVADRIAIYPKK
jgi:hypothetical protein